MFRLSESDNKWRFAFYDQDIALKHPKYCFYNVPYGDPNWHYDLNIMLKKLTENDGFREKFILRFSELIKNAFIMKGFLMKSTHGTKF